MCRCENCNHVIQVVDSKKVYWKEEDHTFYFCSTCDDEMNHSVRTVSC